MEIEKIETYPLLYKLNVPYGDANGFKAYRACYLIRIITRSGLCGWGEVVDWLPLLDKGFRDRIIPFLIGKQANDRTKLITAVAALNRRAASGVSMALTEILAKRARLSVCDLWGGKLVDDVPVYASFQSYTLMPDWQTHSLRHISKAAADGFTSAKLKIGGKTVKEDQRHIDAVQSQFGNHMSLALDANQSYDAAAVRQWTSRFALWPNLLWLEEPLPFDRPEEYKLLRTVLPTALAGGENITAAQGFYPLIAQHSLDILQPDPMHHESIDSFRESLQLARQWGLRVSPHAYDGALTRLYALFAQACIKPWSKMTGETVEPVEWDVMENPFTALLPLRPQNGKVRLPEGIGIGMELDIEHIRAHLWDGQTYK